MPTIEPRIDAYIARAAQFAGPILQHLRGVVHSACPAVVETIKWGVPHFQYEGMLCAMASFKAHCAFGFWKCKLVTGDDTRAREAMGSLGRIESLEDLPSKATLVRLVKRAMTLNESGEKIPRPVKHTPARALRVPADLATALKKSSKARATFAAFTPSARREYIEWITEAKRPETRTQRLALTLEWLTEGKQRNWKYQKGR